MKVREGDSQSNSLSRSMFVQCSQLMGQLSVLFRTVVMACKRAIDREARQRSNDPTDQEIPFTVRIVPLMSAVLIVGRLGWLLKIRGR